MSISSALRISASSWCPAGSDCGLSYSIHGAPISEVRSSQRRKFRKRSEEEEILGRGSCRSYVVTCSSASKGERFDIVSTSTTASGDSHDDAGRRIMVSSDSNSHAPLGAVSNPVFTIESTPLVERMESFDRMDWKGKVAVSAMVVAGLAAAGFAGVKLVRGLRGSTSSQALKKEESKAVGGGGSGSLAYDVVAKGFSTVQENLGPWSFSDLTLGLAAISKVTEREPPAAPGKPAKELEQNASFLARAQHWRSLAEASYAEDPGSFSMQSQLPESTIVAAEWSPCYETLRPAYAVCVDAPHGAVVLSVRGTSQIVDMLVDSGASAESFLDGQAHGGFVKATHSLVEQAVPHIKKAFEDQLKYQKDLKLVITGHSMGAAVGIMAGLQLRESSEFPNVECWGYSTPACVTLDVACRCKDFATSFVSNHDVVPRFSMASVELLRRRICDFDWESADKIVGKDDDWKNIRSAADALKSAQVKQKEIYKSIKQARQDFGEQVDNVNEKISGTSLCEDDNKDTKESGEEKEEERKEHPPLYPPGRLFVLASDPPGSGKLPENRSNVASERSSGTYPTFDEVKKVTWALHEAEHEDLKEIVVSPWCVSDHMIGNLGEGIGNLQRHCEPAFGGPPPV